jgi:hypothetical protein
MKAGKRWGMLGGSVTVYVWRWRIKFTLCTPQSNSWFYVNQKPYNTVNTSKLSYGERFFLNWSFFLIAIFFPYRQPFYIKEVNTVIIFFLLTQSSPVANFPDRQNLHLPPPPPPPSSGLIKAKGGGGGGTTHRTTVSNPPDKRSTGNLWRAPSP